MHSCRHADTYTLTLTYMHKYIHTQGPPIRAHVGKMRIYVRDASRASRSDTARCLQCVVVLSTLALCGGQDDEAAEAGHARQVVVALNDRPRLREFAFASRPQDWHKREQSTACMGGEALVWLERGAQLLSDGNASTSLRCLRVAMRLGCRDAHVYQDMSLARLAMQDLAGALQDAWSAVSAAGCSLASGPGTHCASPELLLNYASLLDKSWPSHATLPRILHILRNYVGVACHRDASGELSCNARGAITAIVELWRLGQLSLSNWDTWQQDLWLLTAAVDADVQRCIAEAGNRYSVVQPWEV